MKDRAQAVCGDSTFDPVNRVSRYFDPEASVLRVEFPLLSASSCSGAVHLSGAGTVWTVAHRPRRPWSRAAQELESLFSLSDNWDGEGAVAPAAALVSSSLELGTILEEAGVEPPARVVAGPLGEILFEWQQGTKKYFEVELESPYQGSWMMVLPGIPARHDKVNARALPSLLRALDEFFRP